MSLETLRTQVSDECPAPGRALGQAEQFVRPVVDLLTHSAVGKGVLSVVDQALVSGTSFVTSVIVARASSADALGIYYLALTLVLFVRGIQSQVVTSPYMVLCHRYHEGDLRSYTGSVLVHQMIFSAMAAVGMAGFAVVLQLGWGQQDLLPSVGVLIAVMPLLLTREFSRNHVLSHMRPITAVLLDGTCAAVQLIPLAVLWRLGWISVTGTYVVMGAASVVVIVLWWIVERHDWQIQFGRIAADWSSNWPLARWALASHLVGCTTPYILPWIVATADSKADAGLLGACGTLAGVANMFVMGLANYLSPSIARAFARGGRAALARVLILATTIFVVVVGGICLVSMLLGEWFVVFVYGPQLAGGGPVLTVSLATVLAISIATIAGNGLWAIDRPQATFLPDVCGLAASLIGAALWIGPHGALGAALAALAGTSTGAVLKALRIVQSLREMPPEKAE